MLLENGEIFLRRTLSEIKIDKECKKTSSLKRAVEEMGPLSFHPVRKIKRTDQEISHTKAT